MIIFVLFNFFSFWPFPWQRQPFWKNQPLAAQLHMAYDIPPRFHKVWLRHLREIERTKMCGRRIIIIIIIRTRNDMIWRIINGSQFQKRWRLSIRKSIYLETKFCPNRRIFVFWWPFWIQNGHHSKPKWSPYGAACLTPCKYPFPLFRYIFEFLTIYFNFILAAILKILETKSTTLSDDLFLCQVSKGSAVRSEFNIFGLTSSTRCGCDRKHYCKTLWSLEWI